MMVYSLPYLMMVYSLPYLMAIISYNILITLQSYIYLFILLDKVSAIPLRLPKLNTLPSPPRLSQSVSALDAILCPPLLQKYYNSDPSSTFVVIFKRRPSLVHLVFNPSLIEPWRYVATDRRPSVGVDVSRVGGGLFSCRRIGARHWRCCGRWLLLNFIYFSNLII